MLSLFVLLYVLIIAIFKTIVFLICAISVFFDNMLNKIKSNQIKSDNYCSQKKKKKKKSPDDQI